MVDDVEGFFPNPGELFFELEPAKMGGPYWSFELVDRNLYIQVRNQPGRLLVEVSAAKGTPARFNRPMPTLRDGIFKVRLAWDARGRLTLRLNEKPSGTGVLRAGTVH
jgi:hypothetical protein